MKDTLGRENRKLSDRRCPNCGKRFRPLRSDSKYCSRPCLWANNGGHNRKPETWWLNNRGYIEGRIWINENTQIRVKKHRWIMENHIGRLLLKNEIVHHINGDTLDNRIENLKIMLFGKHSSLHNGERDHKKGYKLNLSQEERQARSEKAKKMNLAALGRQALAKARPDES